MSNIDPGVDLTWARTVPAFGTTQPIYPTFSPPQFDAAKAYEAANSVMAGKLGNQIKQNEIKQLPVENALRAAQAAGAERTNRIGAATETDQTAADTAKLKADTAASMASIPESEQKVVVYKADALESATTAVEQTDAAQIDDEINRQAAQLKAAGVADEQVNAWTKNVKDATYRAHYHAVAQAARDQYRQTLSLGAGRDTALTKQTTDFTLAANKAYAQVKKDKGTDEEAQKAYDDTLRRLEGQPKPMPATGSPAAAAGATPTVAPPLPWYEDPLGDVKSGLKWLNKAGTPEATPIFGEKTSGLGAPEAAAAGSVQADQKSRAAQVEAKPATPAAAPAEKKTSEEQAVGDGSPQDPYRYAGDPADEDAQVKWVTGLKDGEWFVNPATGKPLVKKAAGGAE